MQYTIIRALNIFFDILVWAIILRSLLSFIIRDFSNPIVAFLNKFVDPLVEPFRVLLHKLKVDTGMIDFSPLLAIIFLRVLNSLIIGLL